MAQTTFFSGFYEMFSGLSFGQSWFRCLMKVSATQSFLNVLLLMLMSFFAIQTWPWLGLIVFMVSMLFGVILHIARPTVNPGAIRKKLETILNEQKSQTSYLIHQEAYKENRQRLHAALGSRNIDSTMPWSDRLMCYVIEPVLYVAILMTLTYGFLDVVHVQNLSFVTIGILLGVYAVLGVVLSTIRRRIRAQECQDYQYLGHVLTSVRQEDKQHQLNQSQQPTLENVLFGRDAATKHTERYPHIRAWHYGLLCLAVVVLVYILMQCLLPFQSLLTAPHWMTWTTVLLLVVVAAIFPISGYNIRILFGLQSCFSVLFIGFFFLSFFQMLWVVFARMPLRVLITHPIVMSLMMVLAFVFAVCYGWWMYDQLTFDHDLCTKPWALGRIQPLEAKPPDKAKKVLPERKQKVKELGGRKDVPDTGASASGHAGQTSPQGSSSLSATTNSSSDLSQGYSSDNSQAQRSSGGVQKRSDGDKTSSQSKGSGQDPSAKAVGGLARVCSQFFTYS